MRVALVSQWYPPERIKLPSVIAEGLAARGHTVDVLTGFPNYPDGRVLAPYRQRPYLREEVAPGVTLHRTPLYPSHDDSAARRSANYLSWAGSASIAAAFKLPRPDVFLVYSSPVTASLPALSASPFEGVPTALLLQDLWPDSIIGSRMARGLPGRAATFGMGLLSQAMYKRADALGVISPGMREVLTERGVDPARIHFTPNWVDTTHLLPELTPTEEARQSLGLPTEGRIFMYAGNLGPLQRLEPTIRAFSGLSGAHLVLLGGGIAKPSLESLVAELEAANIHFLGHRPQEAVGQYLAQADVLLLSLDDTPLLRTTMPSKVQTYLAAGRPVLAHAAGDSAQVIVDAEAGVAAPPGDAETLRRAVSGLLSLAAGELDAMGRRGLRLYEEKMSEKLGLERLELLLDYAQKTRSTRSAG